MNMLPLPCLLILTTLGQASMPLPVLKHSDVIFMYQAPKEIYTAYGATVLAWGGTPTPESLQAAGGMKFFGSVGMVTEFGRYHDRFPETYREGLCRDLKGEPYKVPWLTDHNHKGVPFWWCCTRQPLFRQYIMERVEETLKAGAHGVHIDDHLGTAGSLFVSGGCFCQRCTEEFRVELKTRPHPAAASADRYDFPAEVRKWLSEGEGRRVEGHPLWPKWRSYQLRGAASFMSELRALARKTAGREVPMSANAGLLWGPHLNDYQTLDFFSAEIDHHAAGKVLHDGPLVAYRIADAVGRPLASTASGGDWAFIKEQNKPGLVQGWIAFGYAAGHSLMAPNRQWCYTPEKGTHWYDGPRERFAPLYRFVRHNAKLFDDYSPCADLTIAYAQRTFDRNPGRFIELCRRLSAANISYNLALGGDDVVPHRLSAEQLRRAEKVFVVEVTDFTPEDQEVLKSIRPEQRLASVEEAESIGTKTVRSNLSTIRLLPRVKTGGAVIHVVNWDYDYAADECRPQREIRLTLDLKKLGVASATQATWTTPGADTMKLPLQGSNVTIPQLSLWGFVHLQQP